MVAAIAYETETIIAASYERVSTRAQGQTGFSLGAQHESNEQFARSRGWELPETLRFRDGEHANASGKDLDLPGLNNMLEAAHRREFRYLVVPDRDRFARDVLKAKLLERQLKDYGVHVVYQRAPTEDSDEGALSNDVFFALAAYEIAKTRRRTMNGRLDKARTGRVVGNGAPPYGHRFTSETLPNGKLRVASLEPDPITAPVAVRIVRMARTMSTWQIANALTAEGIPAPRGGRWLSKAVHRIATDPTHIGQWQYAKRSRAGAEVISVPVPALIANADGRIPTEAWLADWHAARGAMSERLAHTGARVPKTEDAFLLRSLLTCGLCGSTLRASSNGTTKNGPLRYYLCGRHAPRRARLLGKPVCALPDVPALALEAEASQILTETLLNPDQLEAGLDAARSAHKGAGRIQRDQRAIIDAEIATHRKTLDTLVDQLATFTSSALIEAVDRRAKDLEDTIANLTRQRDALAAGPGEGLTDAEANAIREFAATARIGLEEATPTERRQLYETLRLRGRVLADPDGVLLGRKNRFRVEWEARIPLVHTASGFLKRDDP